MWGHDGADIRTGGDNAGGNGALPLRKPLGDGLQSGRTIARFAQSQRESHRDESATEVTQACANCAEVHIAMQAA